MSRPIAESPTVKLDASHTADDVGSQKRSTVAILKPFLSSSVFLGSNSFASHLICHAVSLILKLFCSLFLPLNGVLYSL